MNRDTDPQRASGRRPGRRPRPPQKRPTFRISDLPTVRLPGQSRSKGGKTKLTNRRAAIILYALGCGCYRETAAQLAGITVETLYHWMAWPGEPYETFRRLVAKAEADLEARMVTALTSKVDVRPELALAILERKFPQRWGKVTIGVPATGLNVDFPEVLERVMQRLRPANGATPALPPHHPQDPRPPRVMTEPPTVPAQIIDANDPPAESPQPPADDPAPVLPRPPIALFPRARQRS